MAQVELSVSDLTAIRRALARDVLYWQKTKRKDLRPSERAVTVFGAMKTYDKIKEVHDKETGQ